MPTVEKINGQNITWLIQPMQKAVRLISGVSIKEMKLIRLQTFIESDFDQLIAEVPDARFLLQWAGPKYIYPLDIAQLNSTLTKTTGERPSHKVYKAILSNTSETIGHIQLMNIDYNTLSCALGRVLIFQNYRGKGLGKEIVKLAVKDAFENLSLNEIILIVFDFNTIAIKTYKSVGFIEYQFNEGARQFQNEKWNAIKMRLYKDKWLNN